MRFHLPLLLALELLLLLLLLLGRLGRLRRSVGSQAEVPRHLETRAHPLALGRDEVRVERASRDAGVALLREDLEIVDEVRRAAARDEVLGQLAADGLGVHLRVVEARHVRHGDLGPLPVGPRPSS